MFLLNSRRIHWIWDQIRWTFERFLSILTMIETTCLLKSRIDERLLIVTFFSQRHLFLKSLLMFHRSVHVFESIFKFNTSRHCHSSLIANDLDIWHMFFSSFHQENHLSHMCYKTRFRWKSHRDNDSHHFFQNLIFWRY
jgi:hypothetical protein